MRRLLLLGLVIAFLPFFNAQAAELYSKGFELRDGILTFQYQSSPRVEVGGADHGSASVLWGGMAARDDDTLYFTDDNRWRPDWATLRTPIALNATYAEVWRQKRWYMWDQHAVMVIECSNYGQICTAEELRGVHPGRFREIAPGLATDGTRYYQGVKPLHLDTAKVRELSLGSGMTLLYDGTHAIVASRGFHSEYHWGNLEITTSEPLIPIMLPSGDFSGYVRNDSYMWALLSDSYIMRPIALAGNTPEPLGISLMKLGSNYYGGDIKLENVNTADLRMLAPLLWTDGKVIGMNGFIMGKVDDPRLRYVEASLWAEWNGDGTLEDPLSYLSSKFAPALEGCADEDPVMLSTLYQADSCGIYRRDGESWYAPTPSGQSWKAVQDMYGFMTNGAYLLSAYMDTTELKGIGIEISDPATFRVLSSSLAVDDKAIYCGISGLIFKVSDWQNKSIEILSNGIVLEDGEPACIPSLINITVGENKVDWRTYRHLHTGLAIGQDAFGVFVDGERLDGSMTTTLTMLGGWYFQGDKGVFAWNENGGGGQHLYWVGPEGTTKATLLRPDVLWIQEGPWTNMLLRESSPVGFWSGRIADIVHLLPFYDVEEMFATKAKEGTPTYSLQALVTLYERGFIKGYPDMSLRPEASINRAEAAMLLYKGLYSGETCDTQAIAHRFKDVAADIWYALPVCVLVQHGVIQGRDAQHFAPDAPVLFQEFLVMALRSQGAVNLPMTSPWYMSALDSAAGRGWISRVQDYDVAFESDRRDAIWLLAHALGLL